MKLFAVGATGLVLAACSDLLNSMVPNAFIARQVSDRIRWIIENQEPSLQDVDNMKNSSFWEWPYSIDSDRYELPGLTRSSARAAASFFSGYESRYADPQPRELFNLIYNDILQDRRNEIKALQQAELPYENTALSIVDERPTIDIGNRHFVRIFIVQAAIPFQTLPIYGQSFIRDGYCVIARDQLEYFMSRVILPVLENEPDKMIFWDGIVGDPSVEAIKEEVAKMIQQVFRGKSPDEILALLIQATIDHEINHFRFSRMYDPSNLNEALYPLVFRQTATPDYYKSIRTYSEITAPELYCRLNDLSGQPLLGLVKMLDFIGSRQSNHPVKSWHQIPSGDGPLSIINVTYNAIVLALGYVMRLNLVDGINLNSSPAVLDKLLEYTSKSPEDLSFHIRALAGRAITHYKLNTVPLSKDRLKDMGSHPGQNPMIYGMISQTSA